MLSSLWRKKKLFLGIRQAFLGKLFMLLVCLWGEFNSNDVFFNGWDMTRWYIVRLTCLVTFDATIIELAGHLTRNNVTDMCNGTRRGTTRDFGLNLFEPIEPYLCLFVREEKENGKQSRLIRKKKKRKREKV